jgi:uncharacterized membrane protein/cytochrome c2
MFSFLIPHWVEIHAFVNHMPFAFLIAIPVFDIAAIIWRKREWRVVSFWLLVASVIMLFPTAVTGWITGDVLKFTGGAGAPPSLFVWHRAAAFTTAGLAAILLVWRVLAHDDLKGKSLAGSISLGVLAALVVGATGFLGGRMVLGSGSSAPPMIPLANAPASVTAKIPNLDPKLITAGDDLFHNLPCVGCHVMDGKGGKVGPDLTHEAQRHNDPAWHIKHLKDPSMLTPKPDMPSFDYLKPEELKALAAYLATRK